jgi:2-methylcitrate dehydratase PrpD
MTAPNAAPATTAPKLARSLARFALETPWAAMPPSVQSAAVRANLNWLACALAGSQTPTVQSALTAAQALSGAGVHRLIGRRETVDASQAVFINCLSSAAHAFDDTHLKTITHPTGPVAAVVWALAEQQAAQGVRCSGADLLGALVVGMEVECRLSNAIVNHGRGAHLGWYMTGLTGGIGAAIAGARLLGLSPDQAVMAMSLAAAQSGGFRATHGSMGTAFVPAMAARNGLAALRLAQAGFTCTEHAIDGHNGLLAVLSPHCDAALALDGLGQTYEILDNALKPYPCGIVIHPAIDACMALAAQLNNPLEEVASLSLWVHGDTLRLCGRRLPDTALDAQVSVYHWAAASLVHPADALGNAELPRVQDPLLRALQSRIQAQVDDSLQSDQARAQLRTHAGQVLDAFVEHASASSANPMTDEQLNHKFTALSQRALAQAQAQVVQDMSWQLPTLSDPLACLHQACLPERK